MHYDKYLIAVFFDVITDTGVIKHESIRWNM